MASGIILKMAINKAESLKQLSREELEAQVEHANLAIGLLKESLKNEREKTRALLDEREWLKHKFLVRLFKWLDD